MRARGTTRRILVRKEFYSQLAYNVWSHSLNVWIGPPSIANNMYGVLRDDNVRPTSTMNLTSIHRLYPDSGRLMIRLEFG